MKNISDFLINNGTIVNGLINETMMDELFEESDSLIRYIPYVKQNKKNHKLKAGGVVEAMKIAEGKYSTLYRVISVIYPNKLKNDMKLDINKDDIFSEKKFYTFYPNVENAKKEFDGYISDDENSLKFNPLSDIAMANKWYKTLNKTERAFVDLLTNTNIPEY